MEKLSDVKNWLIFKVKFILKYSLLLLVLYSLYSFYFSIFPSPIKAEDILKSESAFTEATKLSLSNSLKNWTPNDITIPFLMSDDLPNFQEGQIEIIRHNARVLRDHFSRLRTTDKLDKNLASVFNLTAIDTRSWIFPSSESKYEEAVNKLHEYQEGIINGDSFFYPRSDNLILLLKQYNSALGGIYTRLNNAVKIKVLSSETEGDSNMKGEKEVIVRVSWYKIDDNFYRALGMSDVLLNSMIGIRKDFEKVLIDKNSVELIDLIIEILKDSNIKPLWVANGHPKSLFPLANKSLQLSTYLQDVRQKIGSLIVALSEG